jgi:hypothetical protein
VAPATKPSSLGRWGREKLENQFKVLEAQKEMLSEDE